MVTMQISQKMHILMQDVYKRQVQCHMSRSNQFSIMVSLLNEGAITFDDLKEFSDDLKDTMKHFGY